MTRRHRLGGIALTVALLAAACSSPDDTAPAAGEEDGTTATSTSAAAADGAATNGEGTADDPAPGEPDGPDDHKGTPAVADGDCPPAPDGVPWTDSVTATMETLQEPGAGTPGVEAAVYPRPDYEGGPWSQWGAGIVLDDGRFLSAIGDHLGVDGNSYLYEYDPDTGTLTQIADALSLSDHQPGDFGYGKIHAPMVPGPCGEIYTSTYWGKRRGLTYTEHYQGDFLVRIDPEDRTIANAGVLLPEHGAASMAAWPEGGLVYAEPADPFGQKTGAFVAYDALAGEIVFQTDDDAHSGYRTIAVDGQGRAYLSWGDGGLARYDPATETVETLDVQLTGGVARVLTGPDPDGVMYGVTRNSPTFFALHPDGTVDDLGPARGYTAAMALTPGGERFYYIPYAHGGAHQEGTPLIAVDTATGDEEVVVELNPLIEDRLGLRTGGTYSLTLDESGDRAYIGLNAGDPAGRNSFGEIVLAVVDLP